MIYLDVSYSQDGNVEIAGDEDALLELCDGLKLCVDSGFEVELAVASDSEFAPFVESLSRIVIIPNDWDNLFSISKEALIIEGDENFLLNLRSNIPWDAADTQSGLSCQVHYCRSSFGDRLDDQSIDAVLTKKRRS